MSLIIIVRLTNYQIDNATIHIVHRPIVNQFDFINSCILRERSALRQLYEEDTSLEWFLARSWNKTSGLVELPESVLDMHNTKELLEGEYFDKFNKDKERLVTLVAQRRVARTKLYESSIKEENSDADPSIKKE